MTPAEVKLVLVLGAVFLAWLGVSLYVVITRAIYDVRERAAGAAREALAARVAGLVERNERGEDFDDVVRRLPRRLVERIASDASTPESIAGAFAAHALARNATGLCRRAAAHRDEATKWRRIAALRILARARAPEADELLERALDDRDEDVVAATVAILGSLGSERAARALVDALRRDVYSASRIATQLDELDAEVPHLILPLLVDYEPRLRFWGAQLLARYAKYLGVDVALASLAGDAEPSVRAAAVESLAGARSSAALATAIGLLDDDVWWVRAHAVRALAGFDRDDVAAYVAPLLGDEQWWVRTAVKEALEARGAEAADVLLPYLDADDEFARNGAAEVLQNTAVLDELVAEVAFNPEEGDSAEIVRKILGAGGPRTLAAALERADPGARSRVLELAAAGEPDRG